MEAVLIPLVGKRGAGMSAIVDRSDLPIVGGFDWHLGAGDYVRTDVHENGQRFGVSMHVLLLGMPAGFIDHWNGNKLDNRRENLRPATRSQNNANRKGWSRHGFKGVKLQSSGRYIARLQVGGQTIHLGTFATAEAAALAYDRAAIEHFGEFARLNFPIDAAQLVAAGP